MTKKKAIEAALMCTCQQPNCNQTTKRPDIAAERAYDAGRIAGRIEGRIAGIREAIAQLPSEGLIRAWDTKRKLRQWANALAKKARAK